MSYFASHSSPGAREQTLRRHTRTTDRSRATTRHADRPKRHARRTSTGTSGAASQERRCGCKADARASGCARPFVARAEAHAGCSTATIARRSPTGTPATDPMALVFAAALLLLKMAPPPGCADRVTKRRATRSVACHTQSHASRRANWVERRAWTRELGVRGWRCAHRRPLCQRGLCACRACPWQRPAKQVRVARVMQAPALVRHRRRCVQRIRVHA